ncbi:MAG: MazG nucleotide pyrophosphohydrolase domain-containing protein [Microgenomates group bacterium]
MSNLTIKELTDLIMKQAKEKGFGTKPEEINVSEKIALIHSEVSEAFEAFRHNDMDGKDGFNQELGDVVSRVLHLAGIMGIDIEEEMLKKLKSNKDRKWDWDKMSESHS